MTKRVVTLPAPAATWFGDNQGSSLHLRQGMAGDIRLDVCGPGGDTQMSFIDADTARLLAAMLLSLADEADRACGVRRRA